MIAIIDYGVGNLKSIHNIYHSIDIKSEITSSQSVIKNASHIILPGVGNFDYVMKHFIDSGLRDIVEEEVFVKGKPILIICVGMQILANKSEEGEMLGLGWIDADVKKLDTSSLKFKPTTPHMGWNSIATSNDKLFEDIPDKSDFYFLHSFCFHPINPDQQIASTFYGADFCSAVRNSNIFGVQFHPEKSHNNGIKLLKNFSKI